MGDHPLNLAFRFFLELAALAGFAALGWTAPPPWHWAAVWMLPLAAAAIWGVFNVPGDPSRSGEAPVVVPGWVRLGLEGAVLIGGAAALGLAGRPALGLAVTLCVLVHYALSLDRVAWLLER
ncbi:MAG: DUF2568 domain-containing protein [Proteobacteria bacterium]|nr:DUF2568 domain-containing protein [Pseudomonadota bacterium]